jgi:hypothetical protein
MGLFDHLPPSERAAELSLRVKRLRRRTKLDVVAMVVVEGTTDEPCLGGICVHGSDQVFSAGSRNLVEQLLIILEKEPIPGCACVYLVDCDGRGKTVHLRDRDALVVTANCDLEADLVELGIAERVITPFVTSTNAARDMVQRAIALAIPVSIVRRAANAQSVSMKRCGRQLALADLPASVLESWEHYVPDDAAAVTAVADQLGWDAATRARVSAAMGIVVRSFHGCALGKDVLDALFRLVHREGLGDVRGWSRDHFHQKVRAALRPEDTNEWGVARRMVAWSESCAHELLA